MWGLPGKAACLLLLMECAYVCRSAEQDATNTENRGDFMVNCRNFGIWRNCLEASVEKYISDEPVGAFPDNSFLEADSRRMHSLSDREITEYFDDIAEGRGKKKKQQKQAIRLMMMMSMIAAKTAAIATAASIMIPLALKAIALLAAKSLIVGKVAVMMASIIGFLKMVQQPDHKTEIIYSDPQRMDMPKIRPIDRGTPNIKPVAPPFSLL